MLSVASSLGSISWSTEHARQASMFEWIYDNRRSLSWNEASCVRVLSSEKSFGRVRMRSAERYDT